MTNVVGPILANARSRPQAAALVLIDGTVVTYAMLDDLMSRVAAHAQVLGLTAGQTVAMRIAGADEALGLIVALGLARAGIATCDPTVPPRHLSAALVAAGEALPPGMVCRPLDAGWLTGPPSLDQPHAGGDGLFRIFATSGTTGLPRFCPVSHAIMAARIAATGHPIARTTFPPVVLCALGLDGNWAMRVVLATLGGGGTLVFSNPGILFSTLVAQRVTSLITSPAVLQSILASMPPTQPPPPALRSIVIGGSRLPDPLWQAAAHRLCAEIMTTFGATETSVVAMGRYQHLALVPQSVGVLQPGAAAQTVDAAHRPLPPGTEGILRVRTQGDITGYLDDPEATASTFRDGWFYTGDIGTVTADGHLVIAGRAVEVINRGGTKISPRLIEDALLAFPGIGQAAAFGVPDRDGITQVWAAVVSTAPVDDAALTSHCAARLGTTAPKVVLRLAEIPRNGNGKVMTHRLIDLARQRQEQGQPALP